MPFALYHGFQEDKKKAAAEEAEWLQFAEANECRLAYEGRGGQSTLVVGVADDSLVVHPYQKLYECQGGVRVIRPRKAD